MSGGSRGTVLAELFCTLFDEQDLRLFLYSGPGGDDFRRVLPGPPVSLATFADLAAGALETRGLVTRDLFVRLRDSRPHRAREIDAAAVRLAERPDTAAQSVPRPARAFISYSHEDEEHRRALERSLSMLRRQRLVESWDDRVITAGDEWRGAIGAALEVADLILLLISADFVASDYCWDVELARAMARHDEGTARVIPIFVRDCDWSGAPFARLQGVPDPKCPIVRRPDRDEAWTEVAKAIRTALVRLA